MLDRTHDSDNADTMSQYFLWYMVFLPLYLPDSIMMRKPRVGATALVLWVIGQVRPAVSLLTGYMLIALGTVASARLQPRVSWTLDFRNRPLARYTCF